MTSIEKKLQSMNDSSFIIKNSKSNELPQNFIYFHNSKEKDNINLNINKFQNKSKIIEAFYSLQIIENNDNKINKNKTCINKDSTSIIIEGKENKQIIDVEEEKE